MLQMPTFIFTFPKSKNIYKGKVRIFNFSEKSLLTSLYKKWSFPLKISAVNVTKSPVSYGYGHIY